MGIYCYTLRTKTVQALTPSGESLEIGHVLFAFKDGWGASETPRAKRLFAAAERARWANPKLTLITVGDFRYALDERLPVFEVSEKFDCWFDGGNPGKLVGYLTKEPRKPFMFEPVKETVDA